MRRRRTPLTLVVLMTAFLLSPAHGQRGTTTAALEGLLHVLPSAVTAHAEALGERVLKPGRERTALTGRFVDDRGESAAMRVTLQLPRMVGLEGLRPNAPAVVFDGRSSVHSISKTEEELLELFSSDTAEAMLAFVKEEAAVHLLGRRVRVSASGAPDAASALYDIYEVVAAVPSHSATLERLKRYSFESDTGLLANTQYLDETYSPPVAIEIRFLDWQRVDGSAYPGRIDRLENGRLTFSWIATRIQALPRQDPSHFGIAAETGR